MKKWEYMEKWTNETANVIGVASVAGQDGWELVTVLPKFGGGYPILFKREILEPPEITMQKKAALEILHDETIKDPTERLARAFAAALGKTEPPTEVKDPEDDPMGLFGLH